MPPLVDEHTTLLMESPTNQEQHLQQQRYSSVTDEEGVGTGTARLLHWSPNRTGQHQQTGAITAANGGLLRYSAANNSSTIPASRPGSSAGTTISSSQTTNQSIRMENSSAEEPPNPRNFGFFSSVFNAYPLPGMGIAGRSTTNNGDSSRIATTARSAGDVSSRSTYESRNVASSDRNVDIEILPNSTTRPHFLSPIASTTQATDMGALDSRIEYGETGNDQFSIDAESFPLTNNGARGAIHLDPALLSASSVSHDLTESNTGTENDDDETSALDNNGDGDDNETENADGDDNDMGDDVTILTHRLRCLFGILTCPIVPLAASLTLLLLWVLYAALISDWGKTCDQPLRAYAILSAAMFAYTPHHRAAKRILFGYWRERDGPVRPWNVRMYDQLYHALCLLWMYAGITWTSNCQTCQATSPNLYHSVRIFVLIQTVFMTILVVPLLCLPCIYLWLVRQASIISAGRDRRRRKRFDPAKVMAGMGRVTEEEFEDLRGKECCICMSELTLPVFSGSEDESKHDEDVEEGGNAVIKTRCDHVFHRTCLSTWLESPYSANCRCPLCRKELVPPEQEGNGESVESLATETSASLSSSSGRGGQNSSEHINNLRTGVNTETTSENVRF